ncbi:MAG: YncE family protein [Candidatus Acidiferrales bacterium]|jgi:DNA-binding beta-propeller fold protein YncE
MKRYSKLWLSSAAALAFVCVFAGVRSAAVAAPSGSGYQVTQTVPIPGEDGWDYMFVDSDARRGYVSHGTRVVVIDIDSLQIVGTVDDTQGVHGIAVAPELGRGFASDGRVNMVTIFDTKTLKTIGTVKAGTNPDAIIFDPVSKRVFAMNGRSGDVTAIDAATGNVAGTMPTGGKLEFAVADGKGSVFVNVEDKSELIEFDSKALKVLHRWPLAPCESPSGLSMDRANRRLFVGCENKMIAVVDADSGKVIATPAIGDGVDATAFDPGLGYAFASNGEGTLTVVKEDSPNSFSVIDNVPTRKSARTMGLDLKSHTVFLPFADFDPPAPGERRGKMKPGSFALLVVEKK